MGAMRISTKGRYAVRVMVDLAQNNTGETVKVKEIAERQGISEKYLEQIIAVLNRAGFVKSTRGAQGGYRLTGSPEDYTVGKILRLTEGPLTPVPCLETCDSERECGRIDTCETAEVWRRLSDAISGVVDHVTLADLTAPRETDEEEKSGGSSKRRREKAEKNCGSSKQQRERTEGGEG